MDVYLEKYLILLTAISVEVGRFNVLAEMGEDIPTEDVNRLRERLQSAVLKAEGVGK